MFQASLTKLYLIARPDLVQHSSYDDANDDSYCGDVQKVGRAL
ncbi:hypothetical protein [Providencia rettgeri]